MHQDRQPLEQRERLQRAYQDLQLDPEAEKRLVDTAMRRLQRPQPRLRPWLLPALALSACASALVLVSLWPKGQPVQAQAAVLYQSQDSPLVVKQAGYELGLEPHSQIVVEQRQRGHTVVDVHNGEVDCSVAKVQPGQSFKVATAHLEVHVVGTRFRVQVDAEGTVVDLREGEVAIYRYHNAAPVIMHAPEKRRFFGDRGEALMQLALEKVDRGDNEQAIELLERYRGMFPQGLFLQESLFHLSVLYYRMGDSDKSRALAREFAQRWPNSERNRRLQQMLQKNRE